MYIRKPNPDGTYQIAFVIAKTNVAPLEKVTLPQLELLGSLLAARLHVFCLISPHLPQSINCKCWTDSTVALSWIKGRPGRWISPRWGGWLERLIHSVKLSLRKTLGSHSSNRIELETTLIKIEGCVNSRPLCFAYDTIDCPNP